jgi:hypothetical protein
MPLRIAMWSGPRNISTAMMRAWKNRDDTIVCDEPLYAFYLKATRIRHPGADEIIAKCETDWRRVVEELTGPTPGGAAVFYQKHMAHHLLPEVGRDWLRELDHVFLIRDPREMLLSLSKVTPHPALEDTGLPQQLELFAGLRSREDRLPPVLDAKDVLLDPEGLLRKLCEVLDLSFQAEMLAWPAGPRESDGIWAPHWYAAVERSTGFEPWQPREGELSPELHQVWEQCVPLYRELHDHRLSA